MVLFVSDEISKENKQEFTEDEETLIIRMYNLVGERLVVHLVFCITCSIEMFKARQHHVYDIVLIRSNGNSGGL